MMMILSVAVMEVLLVVVMAVAMIMR